MRLFRTAATIGLASWASSFIIDSFVIKSDAADPTGFVLQAEGFGLDDVVRLATIGLVGAMALNLLGVRR